MRKRLLTSFYLALGIAGYAHAQYLSSVKSDFIQNTKIGGYVIGRYTATDEKESSTDGGFDVKQARVSVDGKVMDFTYKLQVEASRTTTEGGDDRKVRLLDAFVEWGKYKEFRIKAGEFHRCFTFENPYNPWDIGCDNNAQVINKLVGGRDLGLQFQGDLFPVSDGRSLFSYQVGVFNGQGMNLDDEDKQRDIMGGIAVSPIKDWQIGVFGWKGSYTSNGIKQNRDRWSAGLKYEKDWTIRAEYVSSEGHNTTSTDGWYATVGAPVAKGLKVYAKWDVYRTGKTMEGATSQYDISANYYFCKNVKLQLNYYYTHKGKNLVGDRDYNTLMAEVYCKF